MPDAAFADTERQFIELVREASEGLRVRLRRYLMPGLERTPLVRAYASGRYYDLGLLHQHGADALIVTGTEPLASRLDHEPYWAVLIELLKWAIEATVSAVLSCLAAHAAVLALDGVDRQLLKEKCSGVFGHVVGANHPLSNGLVTPVAMPHSRQNDVPLFPLVERGYAPVLGSPDIGWGVLAGDSGGCLLVLVQGHPEYSTSSLLREHRRDMGRFLRGETTTLPAPPVGYLDNESLCLLDSFASRARRLRGEPGLATQFPFEEIERRLVNSWRGPGRLLYSNWLREVDRRVTRGRGGALGAPASTGRAGVVPPMMAATRQRRA